MLRDERAFTGLEASIVLIAFIVVASVFAYVVVGSGIYVAQKSREVVNSAVDQVSSSLENAGVATSNARYSSGHTFVTINLSLKLPPSSSSVDLSRTMVRMITRNSVNSSVFFPEQGSTVFWMSTRESPPDMILESGEIVELSLVDLEVPPSTPVTFEVIPPQGMQHLMFSLTTPSHYD